jgi:peroxiredoxin
MYRPLLLVSLALTLACDSGAKPPADAPKAATPTPAAPAATPAAPAAAPAQAAPNPLADASASAAIGQPAPDFTLPAADGSTVKLSDFKGKRVVLEWFNPECPFVKAAHGEGALKDLAARTTATGVVWLAINSGAPGKQGHGAEVNKQAAATWSLTHPILLDETGAVGHAYGASNTPHLYLIDDKGVLVYRGALDNAPMGEAEGGTRVAHFEDALAAVAAGKPIAAAETRAWGCSVKYAK